MLIIPEQKQAFDRSLNAKQAEYLLQELKKLEGRSQVRINMLPL